MAAGIPLGIKILPNSSCLDRNLSYRIFILIFTFLCYMSYHLSRKPISIVKSVLHRKNCSVPLVPGDPVNPELSNGTACDWAPFDHDDSATLLGSLDLAYLFAYAVGMFLSGHLAERMNLRHFLSLGMISSGALTAAFGLGYFANIHHLWFYIVIQVFGGLVQSTGWPSVVSCVGNWYGKGKRGFIMGVWNSHTSVGNILGSLIAGAFVNHAWGWSFVVPGIIIASLGVLVFFFLVPEPSIVNCEQPVHQLEDEKSDEVSSTNTLNAVVNSNTYSNTKIPPVCIPTVEYYVNQQNNNGPLPAENLPEKINLGFTDIDIKSPSVNDGVIVISVDSTKIDMENKTNAFFQNGANGCIDNNNKNESVQGERPLVNAQNGKPVVPKKDESTELIKKHQQQPPDKAISFWRALTIPGVIEFSACLFFAKLVSYTFLFWLPKYISANTKYDAEQAGDLSTLFDVGGIAGGIMAGVISDYTQARACTCAVMLTISAPLMYVYNIYGSLSYAHNVGLLLICGYFVNGPYSLITTAVSADLGTHSSLRGNSKALATVTAIIDGTGSIGAAIGPLLTGVISPSGWQNVFWMLISADVMALLLLGRLVMKEIQARMAKYDGDSTLQVNVS